MLLGVLGFNMEDFPVGEIIVAVHRVCPIFYAAKIIRDGMLRTWPVLDVEDLAEAASTGPISLLAPVWRRGRGGPCGPREI